ncbi:MAG TPA: cytochrome c [Burkholderiales bacterium]|nr:cytochrome c [Burkholderiales bacterium]
MLRFLAAGSLLFAYCACLWANQAIAQAVPDKPPIDLNDPAIIQDGEQLYGQTCRYCHGKEGQGGRGPTLRGRDFDFRHVFLRITNGYPPMPAFNNVYTPEQVWKIVAFVRSMK